MKKLKVLFLFTAISLATLYSCTDGDSIQNEAVTKKSFSLRTVLNELKKANNIAGRSEATETDVFCFEFVFPLNLSYNDGTVVSVSSMDGIVDLLTNETESLYIEGIAFPFQVTLATADSATPITISNEADFEVLIASCGFETYEDYVSTGFCYDYVYPFSVINQDGETVVIDSESELFDVIASSDENDIYELVFPLSVTYEGATVVINDIYELFEMDNNCGESSEPCICTEEYAPVCVATATGEIIQFPNSCHAECAGFTSADFVDCDSSGSGSGFDGLGTCYTIQYPVQVMSGGALVTVNDDEGLIEFLNSPAGGATINYPIVISSIATPTTPSVSYTVVSEEALANITAEICN